MPTTSKMTLPRRVKKRDGRVVRFNSQKIFHVILKAAQATGEFAEPEAKRLTSLVLDEVRKEYRQGEIPGVEDIQDLVEATLVSENHYQSAKAFILYREQRRKLRHTKTILGVEDELKLPLNSITVLEKRYLQKNEKGEIIETPKELFERVARAVAEGDKIYDKKADTKKTEEEFYNLMSSLDFLPNSPTLMNAGTDLGQLSACFVLPVEDDINSIFEAVKNTALIHKSGGGTGFSFSRLRPRNDVVSTTGGIASGPISFMKVFDAATDVIKQGGRRRGANMGILRVDHPDILEFITCKEQEGVLANFNISVALTNKFMEAVKKSEDYELINPRDKKSVGKLEARSVFDLIISMAWKNGEPGIIFIDRINQDNPTPAVEKIESTNPCGEQPLLAHESCNLGSINLSHFVKDDGVDWERLKQIVRIATHFLDNVVDVNKYPLEKIQQMTLANRKIGLGIMGFADLLLQLEIPYNSKKALSLAKQTMHFIREQGRQESARLGRKRGSFPNFKKSIWPKKGYKAMRNATVTTIAPTGSIGIIANCSSGIEPLFALSLMRENVLGGTSLLEVNSYFEEVAEKQGFYTDEIMTRIAKEGSIQGIEEIPEKIRKLFVTALDISPDDHIRMQAAFQKFTDNAVSKTINFPRTATVEDIKKAYFLAYQLKCKGVTVYRDMSRNKQVLNIKRDSPIKISKKNKKDVIPDVKTSGLPSFSAKPKNNKIVTKCPECGNSTEIKEGCSTCPSCGWGVCNV